MIAFPSNAAGSASAAVTGWILPTAMSQRSVPIAAERPDALIDIMPAVFDDI
jgi:hypothetical protein